MIINATSRHTVAEYLGDVIAGTQNVGHDEPERKGFGDAPYRFGHVHGGVKSLGEQQWNDDGTVVTTLGELPHDGVEVGLGQVEVGRQCSNSCLLRDSGHQSFDADAALGMPAAVGQSDQRGGWRAQLRQRVSRCAVWVLQRGQNFFNSRRSGSLRRFFLVM